MENKRPNWVYLVPNSITTANIVCGFASILASIDGNYVASAWAIIAAGIFDLIDGRIARMLGASSRFGEQYDTLSDLLSFGVAPAVLYYQLDLRSLGLAGSALALFYLLCVAFRLARFTVTLKGGKESKHFQGLSSPVSAAVSSSFVLYAVQQGLDAQAKRTGALATLLALAVLMVSHLRFPSFKSMNWKSASGGLLLATLSGLVALALVRPSLYLFPILTLFLGVIILLDLAYRVRNRDQIAQ